MEAINELYRKKVPSNELRVGLIVDAYLGEIPKINQRKAPLIAEIFLPKNIELIYASADAGSEYLPNKLVRLADTTATTVIDYFRTGKAQLNPKLLDNQWHEGKRIIFGRSGPLEEI